MADDLPAYLEGADENCPACLAQIEEITKLQDMVIDLQARLIAANRVLLREGLSVAV